MEDSMTATGIAVPPGGDTFHARLRSAMTWRGMSGVRLARAAKIERPALLRLLRGVSKTGPRLTTIETLAVCLRVSPAWLAFGVAWDDVGGSDG